MSAIRFAASIAVMMVCTSTYSQCDNLLPTSTTGEVIHHTYYCLSYDEDHEQAEWTYHVLTSSMLNGFTSLTDNFREADKLLTNLSIGGCLKLQCKSLNTGLLKSRN